MNSRIRTVFAGLVCFFLSIFTIHAAAAPLVVYSGRSETLIGPVLKKFQEKTGIQLDVRYNKTAALATQVLAEGKETPADVMLFQESGYLEVLSKAKLLQQLDTKLLKQVSPHFQDQNGYWIGTSGRARVLVYNTNNVKKEELPKSLKDLTEHKWQGRMGWAPENASFQAHVSALQHLWNQNKTETWLKAVKAQNPVTYANNAAQVKAVASGEIAAAWVNHYYLHQLKQQDPSLTAANYHFQTPHDAGNILMIAGAAIHKESKNTEQAKQLLNYLVSEPTQTYFAQETFEYPTRTGIPAHKDVTPINQLNLAPVKQSWLADIGPTVSLLQKLGIL
jgi:iron(III) transport system substrate-binding protein